MSQETNQTNLKAISDWLRTRDDIAIVTHIFPDGDALGSALALMTALRQMGKRAFVCNQHKTPEYLRLLPFCETVVTPNCLPFSPQAAIALDCSDMSRMGSAARLMNGDVDRAMIDHHVTNRLSISPALVDGEASASGVLICRVLAELGIPLNQDIATCLYVAISTDTGNFSFDNTTPEALCAAADCLRHGVDAAELNFRLFRMRTAGRTRLLGRALNRIEYLEEGRLALLRLNRADFLECDAQDADTEGIVNFGIDTEGAEVAVLATERADSVKFSLRSRGQVDVAQIAAELGGGGHSKAAGVTLPLPAENAVRQVILPCIDAIRVALPPNFSETKG